MLVAALVTVIVAEPDLCGVIVTVSPLIATVATDSVPEVTLNAPAVESPLLLAVNVLFAIGYVTVPLGALNVTEQFALVILQSKLPVVVL